MKKNRITALVLALVMLFALASCSTGGAPATAPDNDADETYTLIYNYCYSEAIGPGQFALQAAESVAERSNGRLTVECYFNGTLLSLRDSLTGCINGVADMIFIDATMLSEGFVLNNVYSLPYLSTPPGKAATDRAYGQLIKDCPELAEEMASVGVMWLAVCTIGGYHLYATEVLDSPKKLGGKTIEGIGEGGNIINAAGGNGVVLDAGDFYMSLSTGLLDGILVMIGELTAFGLYDIVDKHMIFSNSTDIQNYDEMWGGGLYSPAMGVIMNIDSFNKLPADLQQIVLEEYGKYQQITTTLDAPTIITPTIDFITERGDEVIFINNDARQEWASNFDPILENWYGRCDAAGYDGRVVYNRLLELFNEYA